MLLLTWTWGCDHAVRIEQVIGGAIREWREFTGLTQSQLGQALATHTGIAWSRQAVSAAEAGNRAFSAADLLALALTLKVEFGQLLCPASLGENQILELPSGDHVPARILVDLYYGEHGEGLRGSAPVLRSLLSTRSTVSMILENLDDTIGLITQESYEPSIIKTQNEEGDDSQSGEGTDS